MTASELTQNEQGPPAANMAVQMVPPVPNGKINNQFLAAMIDPSSRPTYIPDGFSQPTMCRAYQSVSNYKSSDSDTLIYYVPHAPYQTVGQIWSRTEINGAPTDWKLQNTITNGFNTSQYLGARVVSSRIVVFSDTISTTSAVLSGRITHITTHQLPLQNFDYQEMSSYTSLDYGKVVDVELATGTVGISTPLYLDFKYFIPGQKRQSSTAPPHQSFADQNLTIANNYLYPTQLSYDMIVTLFNGNIPVSGTTVTLQKPLGFVPWASGPVKLDIVFPEFKVPTTGAINTWHTYTYGIEWVSAHLDSGLTYVATSGTVTGQLDANSYNSTTEVTITSKITQNMLEIPIGDNLVGWRIWINDDQGQGVAPSSLTIDYRYDYLSALLDRDLGERQIIWIQGATGQRNYVIKTYAQFQLIPNAELSRNVVLKTCPAATWLPLEQFKYLLVHYDTTGLRLVYTRTAYAELLKDIDKLLNPAYAQEIAASTDGYASGVGYASFKDFIKKVGQGIKKVVPVAARVAGQLIPGAKPVLGALGLAQGFEQQPDVFYNGPSYIEQDGYASSTIGYCSSLETKDFTEQQDVMQDVDQEEEIDVDKALEDLKEEKPIVKEDRLSPEQIEGYIKRCCKYQPALRLWNDDSKEVIRMSGFICVDDNNEYADAPLLFVSMTELINPSRYQPIGKCINGLTIFVNDVFKGFWEPVLTKVYTPDGKEQIVKQPVSEADARKKNEWLLTAISAWPPIKAIGNKFGRDACLFVTISTKLPALMGTSWLGAFYSALQNKNPFNIAEMAANVRNPALHNIEGNQIGLRPIVEWITPGKLEAKVCEQLFTDKEGAFLLMNNNLPKATAKPTMTFWIPSIPSKTMSDEQYQQLVRNLTYYYRSTAMTTDYVELLSSSKSNPKANVMFGSMDMEFTMSWVSPISWVSKVYSVKKNLAGQKGVRGTIAQSKALLDKMNPMRMKFKQLLTDSGINPDTWFSILWSQFGTLYKSTYKMTLTKDDEKDPALTREVVPLMAQAILAGYTEKTAKKILGDSGEVDGWQKVDDTQTTQEDDTQKQAEMEEYEKLIKAIEQKKKQAQENAVKQQRQQKAAGTTGTQLNKSQLAQLKQLLSKK